MIAGFSRSEVEHEALIAPRAAILPLPDTQILQRPGWWQIVTPSLARGGMNEVRCSDLPDDTADAVLDETIASYRRRGIRFRWVLAESTRPADLADRLARRGLVRVELLAMARAVSSEPLEARGPVTVEQVTLATVDDFTRVMAEGWQSDVAPLDTLHRRLLTDPASRSQLFLARHAGHPAAAATYVALDRSAYLMGAVTLPAFRGRGLYRALVSARLHHAAARGLRLATSVAQADTSAPVLARLGFETVCPVTTFVDG